MYPIKKLSEIAKTTSGGTPLRDKNEFWGGNIPWLKSGELGDNLNIEVAEEFITEEGYNNSSAKLFKKGTLLIAMYGATAGKLGILGFDATTNQAICSIQNIHNLFIEKYTYFFLLSIREKIIRDSFGGAQPNISKSYLDNLEIPLPPLSTQSRIVARLDSAFASIDEQISLLRANIADVENMKFGVIEKIFEDGNFEIKTLKDVCERIMDGTHFSPKNSDTGDKLYVSAKNIKLHGVDLTKATYISQEDHEVIYKRCPVKKGDVLYIKDGATTGIATINQLDEEFSLLSSVAVFQVKKNILSEQFLNYYLNSNFGKKHMISMMGGAAITRLTLTKLNSGLIPLPPLPRQHEIVAHLDRVFATTERLRGEYEAQIRDLSTLKQSLLEEAFAGKLVPEENEA